MYILEIHVYGRAEQERNVLGKFSVNDTRGWGR